MRLKNIYILCRDNLQCVNAVEGKTNASNSAYTTVTGWREFLKGYNALHEIEYLREYVSYFMDRVPEIYRHQSTFNVTNEEWRRIARAKEKLVVCMTGVIELYESMGLSNEEKIGIDIKLPNCNTFSDLKKCIDELEFILYRCPFLKNDKEELKFETVDVGSMWLSFAIVGAAIVGGSVVLNNLAAFIDKCWIIRSHKLTVKQQQLQLQSIEMEAKEKSKLLEGINRIYQSLVEKEIKALEAETGISLENGEELGIVIQAMEKTNALIDKGMQLYSTIDSPEEIKVLFEPLEMKYLTITDTKNFIEEKESEDE